ncbi:MAG: sorbosone dehydrogenase [Verrucomicrobiaceae bacterium]|nr:sorbosone dehydrogenase [Verrucomicrobiaceae bacterium]
MKGNYDKLSSGWAYQFFAVSWVIFLGSAEAQRNLRADAIPKPDPQAQLSTFVLDKGLEINLFASDPMISKPIGMNWDEEGRLWVVSSRLYPHIKPGERSDDQVVVLEDTNSDGRADKSTVFAENLIIPTGIMPGDGGAYVANSTEILFLRDGDGDLKEDERRVVLSGFGTEDTHHIIHAFRGGPDGMLYFNQSIYIHSHVETPYGVRRLLAGGIWHYRPETGELEVFARGFVNSWGHVFNRYGQSFATDGANGEGINYVFPGSVFATAHSAKKILRGLNPGQPKQCGLTIVNSSHFPQEWQGNLITNDFRGHRVNRFVISESGSGYVSRQAPDLIRTSHAAFRPIDVKIGPDGALYIADWYNPIIQHGEVDFRDPRRDHVHGRIWRVTYKDRKLARKPKVSGESLPVIVNQLRSEDGFTRHIAKRRLRQEDSTKVKEALRVLIDAGKLSSEDKLEILWAYQSINHLHEKLLRDLLGDADHRIRAATVRIVYHWGKRLKDVMSLLGVAARDQHPQVRLEAVSALRQVGGLDAFRAILPVFSLQRDKNLDFALWLAARELQESWLPALEDGRLSFRGKLPALNFILKAIEKPEGLRFLRDALASDSIKPEGFRELASLFAEVGAPDDLAVLYASALDNVRDAGLRGFALGELSRAARDRNVRPKQLRSPDLLQLLRSGDAMAARLCGEWGIVGAREDLLKWLDEDDRVKVAAEALGNLGMENLGKEGLDALVGLSRDRDREMIFRGAGVAAVAGIDIGLGAGLAADVLGEAESAFGVQKIYDCFLSRVNGADVLAKAIAGKRMVENVAVAGVKQAESSGGKTAGLIAALSRAGGIEPIVRALSPGEMKAFVAEVLKDGDAARGELIYRRSQLLCQNCHAVAGGGGLIGPDLVSIGSSAPVDYIVESLLEPAKKIKEGYHTTVVTTKSGDVVTGGLVRESDSELVLRMVDGSERSVPVAGIAKKEVAPVSMMPPGLTAMLRKDELLDLVRFLTELGKEGDFKVPSGRLARRWRVIAAGDQVSKRLQRVGVKEFLASESQLPWMPAFSRVSGELPLADMAMHVNSGGNLSFASVEVEVSVAGEIGFRIDDPQGLKVSFGGGAFVARDEFARDLGVGRHKVIVIVDRAARLQGGLRLKLFDVTGSRGRAAFVTGY